MRGAIIGDIVGSVYEFDNYRAKDFPLFDGNGTSFFTDDTAMTCAVAWKFLERFKGERSFEQAFRLVGLKFPRLGYGRRFFDWLLSETPKPYNSWGNGAPMRSSPAGWVAKNAEESYKLGAKSAECTHNHPEAMVAAGLTAELVWRARNGQTMDQLRERAAQLYNIEPLDKIRPHYKFTERALLTMPPALSAFFESTGFEDAIRNAVSVGGDSDTIAAITGAIAEAYYGIPDELWEKAKSYLTPWLLNEIINPFLEIYDSSEAK